MFPDKNSSSTYYSVRINQQQVICIIERIYRFSHKDFGLCSQIKIRPQRTIVRLRIILIWRLAKIFMTKSVDKRIKMLQAGMALF